MPFPARRHLAVALAFAGATATASAAPPSRAATEDDAYASIAAIHRAYDAGELTPLDLTRLFLQRIEAIDRAGPKLKSVLETNPDAETIARHVDGGQILEGIPILLKDNIDTGDRMLTTAGSFALAEKPAPFDAAVTARLRRAGAIILGKANLSEWSGFRDPYSVDGWSARGGTTLNPYLLDADPCGSSTGSAAAVAAGLATAAIGTETNGSILCPAGSMGLVGIKPTVGLVSRSGIVPVAPTQDTAGPIARSVADAAIVLTAIAGYDQRDPATADAAAHVTDYTRFLDADALHGKRIGIVPPDPALPGMYSQAIERTIRILESAGAVVVRDGVELPRMASFDVRQDEFIQAEMKHHLPIYLATRDLPVRTLADVIDFNRADAGRELSLFGQQFLLDAQANRMSDGERQALADSLGNEARNIVDDVLKENRLDVLLAAGDWGMSAMAGYPALTLPAAFVGDAPVGLMLYGPRWSEPTLISVAYALERKLNVFQRPRFRKTSTKP